MKKNGFAVIFDTNAYRQFVQGKTIQTAMINIADVVEREKLKDIKAFGAIIPGMEMLGHLAESPGSKNYEECLNGIIIMANHCYDEIKFEPRIFPQAYLHVANSFFGKVPNDILEKTRNLGGVINDFYKDNKAAIEFHNKKNSFNAIKKHIDNEEQQFSSLIEQFIEGIKSEIVKTTPKLSPKKIQDKLLDIINNNDFQKHMAKVIIGFVANTLQIKLSQEDIDKMAIELNKLFPISTGFFKWICHEIVNNKIDMQSNKSKHKRWNWLWDYHVSFAINDSTLDNRKVILVTADTDMTKMLNEYGYKDVVMTLPEYLNFLNN